jgi:hypothetical protein
MSRQSSKERFNDAVTRLANRALAREMAQFDVVDPGEAKAIFYRAILPATVVKFGHRLAHRLIHRRGFGT